MGAGIRELLEHYGHFLDYIHNYSLFVLKVRGKLGELEPQKEQETFTRRLGIPDKLSTLEKRFGISLDDRASIDQMYEARNCLTHDLAIVTARRCRPEGVMILSWKSIEVVAEGENTESRPIAQIIGKVTEEPMNILAKVVAREKKYLPGVKLELSKQDAWEICHFFSAFVIPSSVKAFTAFLERNDVKIELK